MKFKLEELLGNLGSPGKFQLFIFLLLAFNYFPIVFNHVVMAFFGASPKYTCVHDNYNSNLGNGNNTYISNVTTRRQPWVVNSDLGACRSTYFLSDGSNETVACETDSIGHWEYVTGSGETTIVTEWDLVCPSYNFLARLATTIYFCGVMVGGLMFGYLADKFGRKPVMLVTLYLPIVVGIGIAFSPSYLFFVILRFMQGILIQGLQTTSYVLVMEIFLPRYRGIAGAMLEVYWGVTVVILAGFAYFIKTWRYIQLAITLPSVLAIGYIWLVPESLRWLILQRKFIQADKLVVKMTKWNNLPYPSHIMESLKLQMDSETSDRPHQLGFFDLLRTPKMRKQSLILFFLWFAVAVGYYGLLLNMSGLAGNKYLNFFISSMADLVAFVLVVFIVVRFERRKPLLIFFMTGAVSCIAAGTVPFFWKTDSDETELARKRLITGLAIAGKFGLSGVFSLIFLYSSEIYPTIIRNIGMGTCAFWARLGGVVAPQVLQLGDLTHKSTSVIIIGVIALVASGLALLLPETLNRKLPDTIQDVESFHGNNSNNDDDEQQKSMTALEEKA